MICFIKEGMGEGILADTVIDGQSHDEIDYCCKYNSNRLPYRNRPLIDGLLLYNPQDIVKDNYSPK